MSDLKKTDPDIFSAIEKELDRQEYGLELIASENYVSKAVLEAQGSVLTNKYAEGYPGKRYYGGCEYIDIVEDLAIQRAKQIFKAEHANVQPHSGSSANLAVYLTAAEVGSTILGMDLTHGGHLTHGSKVNFSGFLYNVISYGVEKASHRIDYNQVRDLAKKHKPKLIVAGASAYPREIDFKKFGEIANEVGAKLMVDMAHIAGLVAVDIHQSPVPYAQFVTSTTHKTLRGPRGGLILCKEEFAKSINSKIFPGIQGGPLEHIIAAKAVSFKEALQPDFKQYQQQIVKNAKSLAEELKKNGFDLVSGGTDNHLVLVDLTKTGITGKEAEEILGKAGLTVNKNTIPFETQSPFITSGIRIGTPAVTTRGMKAGEMKKIAGWVCQLLESREDLGLPNRINDQVKDLCKKFPVYCATP